MTATPTPGDLSARLQAWLLRHDLNDARSTETRALVSEAAAALSALPAGGGGCGDHDHAKYIPGCPKCALTLPEKTTTPPPDAAVGVYEGVGCVFCDLETDHAAPCTAAVGAQGEDSALIDAALKMLRANGFTQSADAIQRRLAAPAAGKGVDDASERQPDGYAYRYEDGFIRHNGGRDHNGMRPTETIPFYYGSAPALTRQPVAGDGWRPIESAPRDGTFVLVANAHGAWIAKWRPVYQSGYRPSNPWASMMLNHDHIEKPGRFDHPTHWQPLPAAPADTPADGGEG